MSGNNVEFLQSHRVSTFCFLTCRSGQDVSSHPAKACAAALSQQQADRGAQLRDGIIQDEFKQGLIVLLSDTEKK